jgi:excisionase family DNA binding protein
MAKSDCSEQTVTIAPSECVRWGVMEQLNVQLAGLLVAAASFRLSVADEIGILVTDLAAVVRLRQGATTTGELSAWLGFAPGSTTPVVDRLSSAGLIDRTRDPVDKRRIVIRLTDAGTAVSDRADAQLAEVVQDLLRVQNPDILTTTVDSIVTSLTAATPGALDPRPSGARGASSTGNDPPRIEPLSDLLVTSEVAKLFHVSRETIHYWCRTGRLPSYRTAGGHRRFDSQVIRRILAEMDPAQPRGTVGLPPKLVEARVPVDDDVAARPEFVSAEVATEEADVYALDLVSAGAGIDVGLRDAASDRDDVDDMERALEIRTVIGRASGVLMERYNLTVEQALSFLQRDSRTNDQQVHDSADQVIARNHADSERGGDAGTGLPLRSRADVVGGS